MLKSILEAKEYEGLDEALKAHYKERNGKYYLQAEEALELKIALEKEREKSDSLTAKLKELGLNNEEYQKLKEAARQREAEDAKKRGDWEGLEAQLVQKHKEDVKALKDEIKSIKSAHEASFVNAQVATAISSAKGNSKLLTPILANKVKAFEKDGELHLAVLGEDGKPRLKDGAGTPFTLNDLMTELKADQDYGNCFEGSGATGGGTLPPSGITNASGVNARYAELKAKAAQSQLTQAEGYEFVGLSSQIHAQSAKG